MSYNGGVRTATYIGTAVMHVIQRRRQDSHLHWDCCHACHTTEASGQPPTLGLLSCMSYNGGVRTATYIGTAVMHVIQRRRQDSHLHWDCCHACRTTEVSGQPPMLGLLSCMSYNGGVRTATYIGTAVMHANMLQCECFCREHVSLLLISFCEHVISHGFSFYHNLIKVV